MDWLEPELVLLRRLSPFLFNGKELPGARPLPALLEQVDKAKKAERR